MARSALSQHWQHIGALKIMFAPTQERALSFVDLRALNIFQCQLDHLGGLLLMSSRFDWSSLKVRTCCRPARFAVRHVQNSQLAC